jgi:ADP-heptose:LPS heptosyltransferase
MNILVLRALQLGDLLCAVPALRALDAAFPRARITLVGLPWARKFASRFERYVDRFIEFPGFPGMRERALDLEALPAFFYLTRYSQFDLALQMHGSGEITNPLAILLGARRIAGYYRPGRFCPDPGRFLEWRDEEHEVLRWLRLAEHVGAPAQGTHLEFPLHAADLEEAASFALGSYAILHPGSQLASRRWPAQRFAEVGDALAAAGMQIVLTGSAAEAILTRCVKDTMRKPALDLAGRTSLGGLAALVARARVVVSNDTSVSHIAAATRTPSVIVACGSAPRRWAPLNRRLHRVLHREVPCRPCAHGEYPLAGHPCALGVGAAEVINEALKAYACAA